MHLSFFSSGEGMGYEWKGHGVFELHEINRKKNTL